MNNKQINLAGKLQDLELVDPYFDYEYGKATVNYAIEPDDYEPFFERLGLGGDKYDTLTDVMKDYPDAYCNLYVTVAEDKQFTLEMTLVEGWLEKGKEPEAELSSTEMTEDEVNKVMELIERSLKRTGESLDEHLKHSAKLMKEDVPAVEVKIKLTDKILAQFGIKETDSEETIQNKILNGIDDKMPACFTIKATEDIFHSQGEIWTSGREYDAEYYPDRIFADRKHLAEDDFLNSFVITDASPAVAKYMCNEGYGNMFVDFLDKSEVELINSIKEGIIRNNDENSYDDR